MVNGDADIPHFALAIYPDSSVTTYIENVGRCEESRLMSDELVIEAIILAG
jgi:hypothetical protein